ncbi:hypothetical protein TruAng_005910 [Truncatella angustata]|nr:hypothetical protein TruAng_005910 [Truncatella angustata]
MPDPGGSQKQVVCIGGRWVLSQTQGLPLIEPPGDPEPSRLPRVAGYDSMSNYTSPGQDDSSSLCGTPGGGSGCSTTANGTGHDTISPSSTRRSPDHHDTIPRGQLHDNNDIRLTQSPLDDIIPEHLDSLEHDHEDVDSPEHLARNKDLDDGFQSEDESDSSVRSEGAESYHPSDTEAPNSKVSAAMQKKRCKTQATGKGEIHDVPIRKSARKVQSRKDVPITKTKQTAGSTPPAHVQNFQQGTGANRLSTRNLAQRLYEQRAAQAYDHSEIVPENQVTQPSPPKLTSKRVAKPSFLEATAPVNKSLYNVFMDRSKSAFTSNGSKAPQKESKHPAAQTVLKKHTGADSDDPYDFEESPNTSTKKQSAHHANTVTRTHASRSKPEAQRNSTKGKAAVTGRSKVSKFQAHNVYDPFDIEDPTMDEQEQLPTMTRRQGLVQNMKTDDGPSKPPLRVAKPLEQITSKLKRPLHETTGAPRTAGPHSKKKRSPAITESSSEEAPGPTEQPPIERRNMAKIIPFDRQSSPIKLQKLKKKPNTIEKVSESSNNLNVDGNIAGAGDESAYLSVETGAAPSLGKNTHASPQSHFIEPQEAVAPVLGRLPFRKRGVLPHAAENEKGGNKKPLAQNDVPESLETNTHKRGTHRIAHIDALETKKRNAPDTLQTSARSVEQTAPTLPTAQVNRQLSINDTGSPSLVPDSAENQRHGKRGEAWEKTLKQSCPISQVAENVSSPAENNSAPAQGQMQDLPFANNNHHSRAQLRQVNFVALSSRQIAESQSVHDTCGDIPSNQALHLQPQGHDETRRAAIPRTSYIYNSHSFECNNGANQGRIHDDRDDVFSTERHNPQRQQSLFEGRLKQDSQTRVETGVAGLHPKSNAFAQNLFNRVDLPEVSAEASGYPGDPMVHSTDGHRKHTVKMHPKSYSFSQKLSQREAFEKGDCSSGPYANLGQQIQNHGFRNSHRNTAGGSRQGNILDDRYQLRQNGGVELHRPEKQIPREENIDQAFNVRRWEMAVDDTSRSLIDTMHSVTNSLLRHLFSREQAVKGITKEYKQNGHKIAAKLLLRQKEDINDVTVDFRKDFHRLFTAYDDACKITNGLRDQLLSKRRNLDVISSQKRQRLELVRDCISAARNQLKGM